MCVNKIHVDKVTAIPQFYFQITFVFNNRLCFYFRFRKRKAINTKIRLWGSERPTKRTVKHELTNIRERKKKGKCHIKTFNKSEGINIIIQVYYIRLRAHSRKLLAKSSCIINDIFIYTPFPIQIDKINCRNLSKITISIWFFLKQVP